MNLAALKAKLIKRKETRAAYASPDRASAYDMPLTGWNPVHEGTRWVESLEGAGLRFVDYAHKIIRLNHTGWHADSFGESTYRGVVLQFPARDGCPRYIVGYEDPNNPASYRIDWDNGIIVGPKGGENGDHSDELRQAARDADGFAESEAEEARDYDEAWQLGSQYASLGEEIKAERKQALTLVREIKAAGKSFSPAICGTLRQKLASLRQSITHARKARAKLLDVNGWWADKYGRTAFNDGAGETVFA